MRKIIDLILALVVLAGLIWSNHYLNQQTEMAAAEVEYKIVLDPGHGGDDPGKVGINNALEKEINLQVSNLVKNELEQFGITVVMTRNQDEMLAKEHAANKKMEDMEQRIKLIHEEIPLLVVSIHQNSFTDPQVKGAQVFYFSGSQEGKRAAETMQKALLCLDASNHRQAKANDSYYLLKHTEVPVIIVECGFLSNENEAALLISPEYQQQIAAAVGKGICMYLGIK